MPITGYADSSTYTSIGTSDAIWSRWVTFDAGTSAYTDNAWYSWTSDNSTTGIGVTIQSNDYYPIPEPAPLTPEQEEEIRRQLEATLARQREREARRFAAEEKRKAEIAEARQRGMALLLEWMSEKQREQFEKHKTFLVVGQSGKIYEIREGTSGNVIELDENGNPVARYCAHPDNTVELPREDVWLAQKLALEHNEEAFLKVANRSDHVLPSSSPHFATAEG